MTPKRISVKLFAQNPEVIGVPAFTAVLQRWIQERAVEGLLIDVVDYKHMHEGPGIILIGDEGDYAYDLRDGRPGVMYTVKRHDSETLENLLNIAFRRVVSAALKLETENSLNGLQFNYGEAKIEFLDRLNFPNRPQVWETHETALQAFAGSLFAGDNSVTSVHEDIRETFAVRLSAESEINGQDLLARLSPSVAEA